MPRYPPTKTCKIIYADVTIAAFLKGLQVLLGEDDEEWRDVLIWDGGRWAMFGQYGAVDVGSKRADD